MLRPVAVLLAALTTLALALGLAAAPAALGQQDAPLGRIGDTLRLQDDATGVIADVTVLSIELSEIPPGFGYPPRPPRQEVWKAKVAVQVIQAPNPVAIAKAWVFNGNTMTGDAYQPRNTDAAEDLQNGLHNAPAGASVAGFVYWDCYRDLVSHVVVTNKKSGVRLAQWTV